MIVNPNTSTATIKNMASNGEGRKHPSSHVGQDGILRADCQSALFARRH